MIKVLHRNITKYWGECQCREEKCWYINWLYQWF